MECSVFLTPSSWSPIIGSTTSVSAVVYGVNYGTVSSVQFTSSNSSLVTATSPDTTSPYSSNLTAVNSGTATVTATVFMNNGVTTQAVCSTDVSNDSNITEQTSLRLLAQVPL
jgi:uncharacterized protein YjdB